MLEEASEVGEVEADAEVRSEQAQSDRENQSHLDRKKAGGGRETGLLRKHQYPVSGNHHGRSHALPIIHERMGPTLDTILTPERPPPSDEQSVMSHWTCLHIQKYFVRLSIFILPVLLPLR